MKPSGVEWVGDIPTDWDVEPFFKVMPETGRSNSGLTEDNLLSLSYGQIIRKDIDSNDGLLPASFETYQIVEPGDIVFRFTDLQNDKRSLRSALVRERGIITSAYLAVSPKACLPSYANFLLRSYDTTKVFYSFGGGVRQSLKYSDVKRLPVLLPPIDTQRAIVDYLDHETVKIDTLIGKQERLIDVLGERRSAMITQAVTHGLNPDAPMKATGVEWLGNVPEHWTVKSIKWLSPVLRGASPRPIDNQIYFDDDGEWAWVRIADVSASDGHLTNTTQRLSQLGSSLSRKILPGELFVSIAGTVGKPCISGIKACIHDGFVYFPALKIDPMFLFRLFEAGDCYKGLGKLGTQLNLNTDTVGSIRIAVPPDREIASILDHLDRETAKIDALIDKAKAMNVVLRERRSALISAAVTGKIDVAKRIEGVA